MNIRIYHNPRCSKSRKSLELIHDQGQKPEVVEYLLNPPDPVTIQTLANQIGVPLKSLVRTGEDEYKNAQSRVDAMNDSALARWLAANPCALQRPIVVTDKGARIGRPPESILEIL